MKKYTALALCIIMASCAAVPENTQVTETAVTKENTVNSSVSEADTSLTSAETTLTGISETTAEKITSVTDALTTSAPETEAITAENVPEKEFDYTICFTGDISAADGARTTDRWISHGRDTSSCFDEVLISHMNAADICFANNEFPYSTRGSAIPNKDYTYRADPANVQLMLDLGVDIVSLANNHMYDYGPDALLDTLTTLDDEGILHIGAGKDIEEASRTEFIELDGLTVAFINGSRVEWAELTKGATEDSAGVFRTVDPALLYQRTEEAQSLADVVIVYMHWGIEGVEYLEDYQTEVGKGLIDRGADAVIGDHTHCLQGIEFYKGAPIIYSLGNFWFNGKTQRTALAELRISGTRSEHSLELSYIPAMQSECAVSCITSDEEKDRYFRYLESISPNCVFDESGICREKE
ncbi:MAG: CapA family protein [Oscillospiraceae bacterium]|nr:CapA family protein [Oscillospiraceae bacterium]